MSLIDIFQGARRLEDAHPFALLTSLISKNQTVDHALRFDEDLLPTIAEWLATRIDEEGEDEATLNEPVPPDGEPELPEKVDALARIVRRLKNSGYLGGRHTHETNFQTGVAGHLLGFAADVRDRLIQMEIVEAKQTNNGRHIWLNERRLAEIDALIDGQVEDARLRKLCDLE